jgi:hypothetical protein
MESFLYFDDSEQFNENSNPTSKFSSNSSTSNISCIADSQDTDLRSTASTSTPNKIKHNKRSKCWDFFVLDKTRNKLTCHYVDSQTNKICGEELKWCKSTTVMSTHLSLKHDFSNELIETTNQNVKKMLKNQSTYSKDSKDYQNRLEAIFDFIIRTGQPMSLVNNKYMIKMLSIFVNKFVLPSRQELSTKIINNKYEQIHKFLKDKLAKIEYCSITTDCWSSNSNQSYMGTTVHFVDENFIFKSYKISLQYAPESHTSEYLKSELEGLFKKFEIQEKVFSGSSDTANNIKHTLNDLMPNLLYIPFFCHVLNLIVKDVIFDDKNPSICELLSKCRKLVGHFRHSNLLTEQLTAYQHTNGLKVQKLKQEVVTRWNSTYLMLKSIHETHQAVYYVLSRDNSTEHLLSGSDIILPKDHLLY